MSLRDIDIFCRQIRSRSDEHRRAVGLMQLGGLPSQIISILRQELDSKIRVIYLLSIPDNLQRLKLIRATINGKAWTHADSGKKITDRDMVELANTLQGWTESVYRFGCSFIHLSNFHDYRDRDPMKSISVAEKEAILKHIEILS
jgi:hypothetical protein